MKTSFALAVVVAGISACPAPTDVDAPDSASANPVDEPSDVVDDLLDSRPDLRRAPSLDVVPNLQDGVQRVAVRLQGSGAPGPVRVQVASLQMIVDGVELEGTPDGNALDLSAESAWEIATFDLRTESPHVVVTLQFQADGSVERDGEVQSLDLRGPPISLVAEVAQIRASGQVVLVLDLESSLVEQEGRLVLLPYFTVRY